jgi:hypothetical protein
MYEGCATVTAAAAAAASAWHVRQQVMCTRVLVGVLQTCCYTLLHRFPPGGRVYYGCIGNAIILCQHQQCGCHPVYVLIGA